MSHPFDPALLQFCITEHQRTILQAYLDHGVAQHAANALGVHNASIWRALRAVRREAERRGYSPQHDMVRPVPEAFIAKGISTYYDSEGNARGQWVKADLRADAKVQLIRDAIEGLLESVENTSQGKPVILTQPSMDSLLAVYPLGDPHIGMYAWAKECGEDFDLEIARHDLLNAMRRLVAVAPSTDRAMVVNLGDFFHGDNIENRTLRSGNVLDVDSRWGKVLQAGFHVMVDLIDLALTKHQTVEAVCAIGNHDDHSSVALSAFLSAWYRQEPRVVIHDAVGKFHYIEHGATLVGITHGDTIKLGELGSLMAADKPEAWGRTVHRYWYTGHIHNTQRHEQRGCVVESFRTLAAKDAWHTAHGYRAGRDMYCIVLDALDGEVERHRCDIQRARRQEVMT